MSKHVQKPGRKPVDARFTEEINDPAMTLILIDSKIREIEVRVKTDLRAREDLIKWRDEVKSLIQ